MDSLEPKILDFIANESGIQRDKVLLASRISQDLGIEGLDAEELFEKFSEKFKVDLTTLWDYWEFHFAREGGAGWSFLIPCFIFLFLGEAIYEAIGWLPFWVYSAALLVLWIGPLRCWPLARKSPIQITVQEMVEAARQGKWAKSYEA